jgi:uncharacterized membrane protein
MLPAESLGGVEIAAIVAVLVIVLVCFVTGVFVASRFGSRLFAAMERWVFGRIPGYALLKSLTLSFSFVPLAPTPSVGRVYIVQEAQIRRLQGSMGPALGAVMQWGVGLQDVLREQTR